VVDFTLVLAFTAAPTIFDFPGDAARIAYSIAFAHAALSLLTAYSFGLVKWISCGVHGAMESAAAVASMLLPWLADFNHRPTSFFFTVAGSALLLVKLATDCSTHDEPVRGRRSFADPRQRT